MPSDSAIRRFLQGLRLAQPYVAGIREPEIVSAAWKRWLHSLPSGLGLVDQPMDSLRAHMQAVFSDCTGRHCERMRLRIENTATAQDLWLMRGEIFQLVAGQHCQSVAAARLNALVPHFEGWIPDRFLTRI